MKKIKRYLLMAVLILWIVLAFFASGACSEFAKTAGWFYNVVALLNLGVHGYFIYKTAKAWWPIMFSKNNATE